MSKTMIFPPSKSWSILAINIFKVGKESWTTIQTL